jgi:hypothetical protein
MAGFEMRRTNGRWSFRAQGCCGNLSAWEREYERAFAEQVLRDRGRIEWSVDGPSLVDRHGRRHSIEPSIATALDSGQSLPAT